MHHSLKRSNEYDSPHTKRRKLADGTAQKPESDQQSDRDDAGSSIDDDVVASDVPATEIGPRVVSKKRPNEGESEVGPPRKCRKVHIVNSSDSDSEEDGSYGNVPMEPSSLTTKGSNETTEEISQEEEEADGDDDNEESG